MMRHFESLTVTHTNKPFKVNLKPKTWGLLCIWLSGFTGSVNSLLKRWQYFLFKTPSFTHLRLFHCSCLFTWMMTWNIAKNPWGEKTHAHTHTSTYSGIEQLVCGSSDGIRVGKRVKVCKQVEPGRHVFGSPRGSCRFGSWLSWLVWTLRNLQGWSLEHRRGCPTCGAQTVIQQLGGQKACGARGVRGWTCCCCTTLCSLAGCGDAGRGKHPKSVLPFSAELIASS